MTADALWRMPVRARFAKRMQERKEEHFVRYRQTCSL